MTLLDKIKEKNCRVIVTNVDGISGYFFKSIIFNILGEESYWKDYSLVHSLYTKFQHYIGGTLEEIPDSEIIKFWMQQTNYLIISTCWDYERTIKAVKDAQVSNVRIYEFCRSTTITDFPF